MIRIVTTSEEETLRLGERLGARLLPGDTVLLEGEMGAGKSVLSRGVARGLGVEGPIPSPTFTIVNVHDGARGRLYHFDLYRLEDADAFWEAGLDEMIGADGVALIEWPSRAPEAMPERRLCVEIAYVPGDPQRREITLLPQGGFDEAPLAALTEVEA